MCVSAVQWQVRKQAWLDQKSMCWSMTTAMSQRHAAAGICVCVSAVQWQERKQAGVWSDQYLFDYLAVARGSTFWYGT